jgi:Sec-independent protein translocase protein TatA
MGADLLIPLVVILILVVMWRGPKTLPKLGEALGRGIKEAKSEAAEVRKRTGEDGSPTDGAASPPS